MRPIAYLLAVVLCGSLTTLAHAQRGGGGGCQRGGGMMTTPTPTAASAFVPLSMNMPRETSSMAYQRGQRELAQQLTQVLRMQETEKAQQEARAAKEETRQRKIAALQKRREDEKTKRAAARAKAKGTETRLTADR